MSLDSDIKLLSQVKLFQGFKLEQLRLLAFGAEARTLGRGTMLYHADTNADSGFVIVRGQVNLTSGLQGEVVSVHGTGSLLAEMALITSTQHAATAVAAEHTEVLKITRPLFRRMLEEYPELAEILQHRISQTVNEFVEKLDVIRAKLDHANDLASRPYKGNQKAS